MSTTTPKPAASPRPNVGGLGLTDKNTHGAARHTDLYRLKGDPVEERKEKAKQARILGLGFLVMFGLIIGGLSMSFNGVWKTGFAAAFPKLPETDGLDLRAHNPQFRVAGAGASEWRAVGEVELADATDRLEPSQVADLTPVHIWVNRKFKATAYARLNAGETLAELRIPNLAPAPIRPQAEHAFQEAKLFGLLPTRFPMLFGFAMGLLGLIAPVLLIPFYDWWMTWVTAPLGFVNTRIILGIVFFVMFTPIALVLRI